MKKLTILLASLAMATSMSAQQTAKPGARWWWLGSAVDKENIRWNMEQYAKHGIGALEITPLYGVKGNDKNNIDFLSPKWMEMLSYVEAEGKRLGIEIDMNQGTGWPFGGPTTTIDDAACKLVVVDNTVTVASMKQGVAFQVPEKEQKTSRLDFVMAYLQDGSVMEVTQYMKDNSLLLPSAVQKQMKKAAPRGVTPEVRVIAVYVGRTRQQVKRAAPGGQGYVIDHFDRGAVKRYFDKFDKAFTETGTPWPQVSFNDSYEVYGADWTPTLPEEFQKRRGYSLKENIHRLVDRDVAVVSDYRETLSDMLRENFTNQWVEWAHSHGMIVKNQAHGSPANLLDLYAAVDIPEIEGFGLSEFGIKGLRTDPGMTKLNDSDYSMFKYAPSAAHVTGKNLISSETFTWLTEHFRTSLSQMKPDLDLMFCAGVNHMYYHGICYSPKNDTWPGWKFYASVDMSPTNSIWRDAKYFNDYIERTQKFLQWGKPDNDILVYFPVHDLWKKNTKTLLMQFAIHNLGHLAPEFKQSILELDHLGYDCDYISDRQLLASSSQNCRIATEAGIEYKALLIPDGAVLPDDVKAHVEALKQKGVTVIYGNDVNALAKVAQPETMKTQHGLKMIRRRNDGGYHYFIANLTPDDIDAKVQLAVTYEGAKWYDPLTDQWYESETDGDGIRIALKSGESMILETFNRVLEVPGSGRRAAIQPDDAPSRLDDSQILAVKPGTEIPGTSVGIDKGWCLSFTEEAPQVKGSFNIDQLQTWETLDDDSAKVTMGTGVYETTFEMHAPAVKGKKVKAGTPLSGVYAIDLGDVRESARVYINNEFVGCAWSVPYTLQFAGSLLKEGTNSIRIEVTNLPANRIADLDRRGVEWRKFEEINVVDIKYKNTKYDKWAPMPSGLNSTVRIYAVK